MTAAAALRWREAARQRVRDAGYLRRWMIVGGLLGVAGGIGAIAFSVALELATRLFLGLLAGFEPASPFGEGGAPITDPLRPWALPIVVAIGGLISGIIVVRFAPEAEGHGTDAAIAAYHHAPRSIRARVPLVKLVASAVTIGSGGSAGREGPTAQISAGFGSWLSRFLDLDQRDARIAIAAGMAAGIGAIFRAPLGAAVLGAELMYRDDVESEALVPSFIATIVAYAIFGSVVGFQPIFGEQSQYLFSDPLQLPAYAVLGVAAGLVGIAYIRTFYGMADRFSRWSLPAWSRPALAGVAVGAMGIVIPGVLGTGYGWVQASMSRETLLALPVLAILVLPFAKILATALTIGSGGSGGIFGPGMVVGGLVGASLWRLLEPVLPMIPADPAPFVIVGMMALFGSVAHAPLAVMLMVAEMTGNLGMLAPAMVAVGLASVVVGERSIYRSQLRSQADAPANRYRVALPMLATISVADAARQPVLVLPRELSAGAAVARLEAAGEIAAAVTAPNGRLIGVAELARLRGTEPSRSVAEAMDASEPWVGADDRLDEALGLLAEHGRPWMPVEHDGQLVGVLSVQDAMRAYRRALSGNIRRVQGIRADGILLEAVLAQGSELADRDVRDIAWPDGVVLVAIERAEAVVVPRGDVKLRAGDHLSLFSTVASEHEARRVLGIATGSVEAA